MGEFTILRVKSQSHIITIMKSIKNNILAKNFGIKVKLERVKMNLSQEKFAELADLSKASLGAIERGESSPTLDTIGAIAKAFGISICELVDVEKINL